jgi:hypothetical protein
MAFLGQFLVDFPLRQHLLTLRGSFWYSRTRVGQCLACRTCTIINKLAQAISPSRFQTIRSGYKLRLDYKCLFLALYQFFFAGMALYYGKQEIFKLFLLEFNDRFFEGRFKLSSQLEPLAQNCSRRWNPFSGPTVFLAPVRSTTKPLGQLRKLSVLPKW